MTQAPTPPIPPWAEGLDWSRSLTALAREAGVSVERVRQVRAALKLPTKRAEQAERAKELRARIRELAKARKTRAEIQAELGVGEWTVKQALRPTRIKRGKSGPKGTVAWDTITPQEWRTQLNTTIAERLGTHPVVVAQYRREHKLPPSPYRRRKAKAP